MNVWKAASLSKGESTRSCKFEQRGEYKELQVCAKGRAQGAASLSKGRVQGAASLSKGEHKELQV